MINDHQSVSKFSSKFRYVVYHWANEWRGEWHILDEDDSPFHLILKDQFRAMDYTQIKSRESEEFKNTSHFLADDKLLEYSMNRMRIEHRDETKVDMKPYVDLEQELLIFMSTWSLAKRKARSWFTSKQINELKNILSKFPNHQVTVRKFLKLSKTSFNRLQREINEQEYPSTENKRNIRENKNLSNIQKAYIRQFVRPPTVPLTLNEI